MISFARIVLIALCLSTLAIAPNTPGGAAFLTEPAGVNPPPAPRQSKETASWETKLTVDKSNKDLAVTGFEDAIEAALLGAECSPLADIRFLQHASKQKVPTMGIKLSREKGFVFYVNQGDTPKASLTVRCPAAFTKYAFNEFRRMNELIKNEKAHIRAARFRNLFRHFKFHFDTMKIELSIFVGDKKRVFPYVGVLKVFRAELGIAKNQDLNEVGLKFVDSKGDKFTVTVKGEPMHREFSVTEVCKNNKGLEDLLITAINMSTVSRETRKTNMATISEE